MTQKVYNANERIVKWYDWYCKPGFSRQIRSNHYYEKVEEASITPGTNESEGFLRSPTIPHILNSMSTPLSNRILPHLNPYEMYSMDTADDVCMKVYPLGEKILKYHEAIFGLFWSCWLAIGLTFLPPWTRPWTSYIIRPKGMSKWWPSRYNVSIKHRGA